MTEPGVELGINLSFAVKRWPEPEAWAAIVADELGLERVQFSFDLIDPWWPEELRRPLARRTRAALDAHGLTLHSAFVGLAAYSYNALLHPEPEGRAAARLWWERAVDLAAELGAPAVGGPLGGLSVRQAADPDEAAARRRDLLEAVRALARRARERGLRELLVEPTPLPREIPWTPSGALELLEDLGDTAVPVRYAVDLGHALYRPLYGDDAALAPWLERLGDRVALVHLQQTDGESDAHWGFDRDGIVDPAAVARAAAAAGIGSVPMLLEVFYPFELADEEVRAQLGEGVRRLRGALAALTP